MSSAASEKVRKFRGFTWALPAAGVFATAFMLLFTAWLTPGLYARNAWITAFFLLFLVSAGALYGGLIFRLRLPFTGHMLLFILTQWAALVGREWLTAGACPRYFYNPFHAFEYHPGWALVGASSWFLSQFIASRLRRLQQPPRFILEKDLSTGKKVRRPAQNLEIWRKGWRSWYRTVLWLVVLSGAAPSAAGFFRRKPAPFPLKILTRLGPALVAAAGLMLISAGYLYFQRAKWRNERLIPGKKLVEMWGRWTIGISLIAAVSALLIPAWPQIPPQIWLAWLVHIVRMIFRGMFNTADQPPAPSPRFGRSFIRAKAPDPGLWMQIIAVLYAAFTFIVIPLTGLFGLAVFAGSMLARFKKNEAEKLKGLPRVLIRLYYLWRKMLQRLLNINLLNPFRTGGRMNSRDEPLAAHKTRRYFWGFGRKAVVRREYYNLVDNARLHGMAWKAADTPAEIGEGLARLSGKPGETAEITAVYLQARYGKDVPLRPEVLDYIGKCRRVRKLIQRQSENHGR
ncbi:MAG: hypothetical protein ACM3WV_03355 [Bacillota bacterium]